MRRFVAVVVRELAERVPLFLLGCALALLVQLSVLVPVDWNRDEVRLAAAAVLTALFAVTSCFVLSASLVGSDVAARRLSFYLSRPLRPATIWFGKLFAATLLIDVPSLLIAAPLLTRVDAQFVVAAMLLPPWLIAIGHAIATAIRARSSRPLLDVLLFAIAIGAFWLCLAPLRTAGAVILERTMLALFALIALLATLRAGVQQVRAGDASPQRTYAAWSRGWWRTMVGTFLVVVALCAIYGFVLPFDGVLISMHVGGDWVGETHFAIGELDYLRFRLRNVATGDEFRGTPSIIGAAPVMTSADGKHLFAYVGTIHNGLSLLHVDLARRRASIVDSFLGELSAVSADGALLAAYDVDELLLADVRSNTVRSVATSGAPAAYWFSGPTKLRIAEIEGPKAFAIREVDAVTGRATNVSRAELPNVEGAWIAVSPSRRHLLVTSPRLRRLYDVDGRFIAELPSSGAASFLLGDRVAVRTPSPAMLRVYEPDGRLLRTVVFPTYDVIQLHGEPAPLHFIVNGAPRDALTEHAHPRWLLVDASKANASVRNLHMRLRPSYAVALGDNAAFFATPDGVWRLDANRGTMRLVSRPTTHIPVWLQEAMVRFSPPMV